VNDIAQQPAGFTDLATAASLLVSSENCCTEKGGLVALPKKLSAQNSRE